MGLTSSSGSIHSNSLYTSNSMAFLYIFLLLHFPVLALSSYHTFLVPSGYGESYSFDPKGDTFYVSVNDGRVMKYGGADVGFVYFAHASPTRTKEFCDFTDDPEKGNICGRALGLSYNYNTGKLTIADAYHGLLEVGPEGGLATQVSNTAGGLPYKWLDGLDVDQQTGKIYFTDVSTKYNLSQLNESVSTGDATGRFIEYNPVTKSSRVLMSGLVGPGGAATSIDGSFVLMSEFVGSRITKYWLTGPKADTWESFMNITSPTNMKRLPSGNYWVAVNNRTSGTLVRTGVKFDQYGNILKVIPFNGIPYDVNATINEVHEHRGKLFISCIHQKHGVIYTPAADDEVDPLDSVMEGSSSLSSFGEANLLAENM